MPIQKKSKKLPIKISGNDLKAFQWMAEQGAMSVEQLWHAIWKTNDSTYPFKRVKRIVDHGFLERLPRTFGGSRYYRITHKAYDLLCDPRLKIQTKIPIQRIKPSELPHCSALTDLRISVENSGKGIVWTSDRVLALELKNTRLRSRVLCPDAIYLTKKGERVAVEYERTRKVRSRVLKKIHSYTQELLRADRFIDHVVWIVDPQANQEAYNLVKMSKFQSIQTTDSFKQIFKVS
ncbi:MAG: replication-relaxation family protein [Bdellovibrionia bacterium]